MVGPEAIWRYKCSGKGVQFTIESTELSRWDGDERPTNWNAMDFTIKGITK